MFLLSDVAFLVFVAAAEKFRIARLLVVVVMAFEDVEEMRGEIMIGG